MKRGEQPARKRAARPTVAAQAPSVAKLPTDQPAAIADRGEHELKLAGIAYRLRPSFKAIVAIEQKTGLASLDLITRGNTGRLTYEQLGIVAAELIREGAEDDITRAVNAERLGEMIFEEGLSGPMSRLTLCMLNAATGGRDAAGNVKAAAA